MKADRGRDSVCSAMRTLVEANDRRDARALRRMVVYDRARTPSCNLIALSDPWFDASDAQIAPDGSQSRAQTVSPACPLPVERAVRSATRAIASSLFAFASPIRRSRSAPRNSL
jgi:hypothetical protein